MIIFTVAALCFISALAAGRALRRYENDQQRARRERITPEDLQ